MKTDIDFGLYYLIASRIFRVLNSSKFFACGGHLLVTKLTIPFVGLSLILSFYLIE